MNITTLIIENLRAMGANPETIPGAPGEILIKINAPRADRERIGTNEKTENKKT